MGQSQMVGAGERRLCYTNLSSGKGLSIQIINIPSFGAFILAQTSTSCGKNETISTTIL